jgi:hypothetical protein
MAKLARVTMNITELTAAILAALACGSGARVSNRVCQVTYFYDLATV